MCVLNTRSILLLFLLWIGLAGCSQEKQEALPLKFAPDGSMGGPIAAEARALVDQCDDLIIRVVVDEGTSEEQTYNVTNLQHDESCSQFTGKIDIPLTKNTYRLTLQYWVASSPYGEVLLLTTEALPLDITPDQSSLADFSGSSYFYPDTDGDGYTNVDELKAGSHPSNHRSMPRLSPPGDFHLVPIDYNIIVNWTAEENAKYTLYVATQPELTKQNFFKKYDDVRPGFKLPEPGLEPEQTYYIAVTSINGSGEEGDLSQIQHAMPLWGVPPGVDSIFPARDATNVERSTAIEIKFTEPMIGESVENAFSIKDLTLGKDVSGQKVYDIDKRQLRFLPAQPLNFTSRYEVVLSNAKNLADKRLRDFQWQFSTGDGEISMGEGIVFPGLFNQAESPIIRSNAEGVVIALWMRTYWNEVLADTVKSESILYEKVIYGSIYSPAVGWLPSEIIARFDGSMDAMYTIDAVVQQDGSILVVWHSVKDIRFNVAHYNESAQQYVWENAAEDYAKDSDVGALREDWPQTRWISDFVLASNDNQFTVAVWKVGAVSNTQTSSIHARFFTSSEWQPEKKIAEEMPDRYFSRIQAAITQTGSTVVVWKDSPRNSPENSQENNLLQASAYLTNGWSERVQVASAPTGDVGKVYMADVGPNQVSVVWLGSYYDKMTDGFRQAVMELRLRIDPEGGPPAEESGPTVLVEGGTAESPSEIGDVKLSGKNGNIVLTWINEESPKLYARRLLPDQRWSSEERIHAGIGEDFDLDEFNIALADAKNIAVLWAYTIHNLENDANKKLRALAYSKYDGDSWQTEIVRDPEENSRYTNLALVLDKRAQPRLFWDHSRTIQDSLGDYRAGFMVSTSLETNGAWAIPKPIPQAIVADATLEKVGKNCFAIDWIQLDGRSHFIQEPIDWIQRTARSDSLVHKAPRFEGIFTVEDGWHDVSNLNSYKWINTASPKLVTHVDEKRRITIGEIRGDFYFQIKTISSWLPPRIFHSSNNVDQRPHFVRLENTSGQLELIWNASLPPSSSDGVEQGQALYLRHYDPQQGWRSQEQVFNAKQNYLYIEKGISNPRGDIILVGSSTNLDLSGNDITYSGANAHIKNNGSWKTFDNFKFDNDNGECAIAEPSTKEECPSQRAEDVALDEDGNAVAVWIQREVASARTPFSPMIYRYFKAEAERWFESNPIALKAGSQLGDVRVRSGATGQTHLVWSVDEKVWTASIQDLGNEIENWSEPRLLAEGHDSGASHMVLEADAVGNFLLAWKSMDATGAPAVHVRRYTVSKGWSELPTTINLDPNVVDISTLDVKFADDGSAMLAWGQVWKNEQGPVIGTALFK